MSQAIDDQNVSHRAFHGRLQKRAYREQRGKVQPNSIVGVVYKVTGAGCEGWGGKDLAVGEVGTRCRSRFGGSHVLGTMLKIKVLQQYFRFKTFGYTKKVRSGNKSTKEGGVDNAADISSSLIFISADTYSTNSGREMIHWNVGGYSQLGRWVPRCCPLAWFYQNILLMAN